MILVRGKGTTDMAKDLCGSPSQRLCNAAPYLAQQQLKSAAVMIMRHDPSRDPPEPFNAVGIRIIGRCIHQGEVLLELGEPGSRTSREPAEV